MRVLLIYNPTAGEEDVEPEELASALRSVGHEVQACSTVDRWDGAVAGDAELVVVAGGDGAVSKVFKRLAGGGKLAALLPLGSANNIATALGYSVGASPEETIRSLKTARRVRFDLGLASWDGSEQSFAESAGFGVFADVLARAAGVEPKPSGKEKIELGLRLLVETVEGAAPRRCHVEVDEIDLAGDYIAVEVTNVGLAGPNVPFVPQAKPGDGRLDLALVRADDAPKLTDYAVARLEGRSPPPLQLEVHRGRGIHLRLPDGRRFHLDDELAEPAAEGYSLRVGAALEVLVPANAA